MTDWLDIESALKDGTDDYLIQLKESYLETKSIDPCLETPLEYLGNYIFDFTTYDGSISELFAKKALEVCKCISDKTTFEYQKNPENYRWFLLMCNMHFFSSKIEWGTSIRGCWWNCYKEGITVETTGLFIDGEQITQAQFNETEWLAFVEAMIEFAKAPTDNTR